MIEHFKIPCEPQTDLPTMPVAERSFTVVVGPGRPLTAVLFVDDRPTTSYRLDPDELPAFLRWMGDYCEEARVPLNFAVAAKDIGQGVPLPCPPPPPPPPSIEHLGPTLQRAFDDLWKTTAGVFLASGGE